LIGIARGYLSLIWQQLYSNSIQNLLSNANKKGFANFAKPVMKTIG
jgi:hypothetical protein